MGAHLIDGEFQSDKYPTCPRGKVPLSAHDPLAQDLLWEYAQRRRPVDAEFSDDLEAALRLAGHTPPGPNEQSVETRKAMGPREQDLDFAQALDFAYGLSLDVHEQPPSMDDFFRRASRFGWTREEFDAWAKDYVWV